MLNLFHGTTLKGAEDIIKNGYDYFKGNKAWNCSSPKHIYFYNPIKMLECELGIAEEESSIDDWIEAERLCLSYAKGNADIQNALSPNPDNQVCVLEFIFNDEIELEALNWLGDDYSCQNMEVASTLPVEFLNECIKNKKVGIVLHYFHFHSKLSLFYLVSLLDNPYMSTALENLPQEEYDTLKFLSSVDTCEITEMLMEDDEILDKKYFNNTHKEH